MADGRRKGNREVGKIETSIKVPLFFEDLPGFAEGERFPYALIVSKILWFTNPESSVSRRLHEAVENNRNMPTQQTRNLIKDFVSEQFLQRSIQHKRHYPPARELGSNAAVNTIRGPANDVLETIELLELILSNISTVEIVNISRVSKMFLGVMKTSPILQAKLFLRPIEPTTTLDLFANVIQPGYTWQRSDYVLADLNPLLQVDNFLAQKHMEKRPRALGDLAFFDFRMLRASCWTNMYLTNPPCVEARIRLVYSSYHPTAFEPYTRHYRVMADLTIRRGNGVTIGMLMEAAYSKAWITTTGNPRRSSFLFSTVAAEVQRCEAEKCCKFQLDFEETDVQLVGIAVPAEKDPHELERWGYKIVRSFVGFHNKCEVIVKVKDGKPVSDAAKRAVSFTAA